VMAVDESRGHPSREVLHGTDRHIGLACAGPSPRIFPCESFGRITTNQHHSRMQIEDTLKLLPGMHFEATQQEDEEGTAQPAAALPGGVDNQAICWGAALSRRTSIQSSDAQYHWSRACMHSGAK